jgi:hypothetical protein
MWCIHYFCPTAAAIAMFRHILIRLLNIKFHENPFCRSRMFYVYIYEGRRTDELIECNRYPQDVESAKNQRAQIYGLSCSSVVA